MDTVCHSNWSKGYARWYSSNVIERECIVSDTMYHGKEEVCYVLYVVQIPSLIMTAMAKAIVFLRNKG